MKPSANVVTAISVATIVATGAVTLYFDKKARDLESQINAARRQMMRDNLRIAADMSNLKFKLSHPGQ